MRFDREKFFSGYRAAFGAIQQLQVAGLDFLLSEIEADPEWKSLPQMAYFLATIKHETGITRNNVYQAFQPIKELRAKAGTKGRRNQDRYWLSGYYGRGYIQLTWDYNYKKFGIADTPDKALEPATAYMIASRGMREGVFTGRKLSDYINGEVDYVHARKIVNGLDRANDIAEIAVKFERILKASQVDAEKSAAEKPAIIITPTETEKKPPPVETLPTNPKTVEVKAQGASLPTKIAAAAAPVGAAATALGIKIGNVQLSEPSIIALCAVIGIAIIVGAYLYNQGQNRAQKRLELSMENLANKDRHNVVAGSGD